MTRRTDGQRWWAGLVTLALLTGVTLLALAPGSSAHADGDESDGLGDGGSGAPAESLYVKDVRISYPDGSRVGLFRCTGSETSSSILWECTDGRGTSWDQETDLQDEPTIEDYDCHFKRKADCPGTRDNDASAEGDGDGAAEGSGDAQPASGADPSVLIVETLTETQYWYAINWGMAYYQAQRQAYVYDPYYGRLVPTDDPWGGRTTTTYDPYAR